MTPDPYAGGELTDGDLRGEIELVGDLVVAAADSDAHLSQAEIDQILGVCSLGGRDAVQDPVQDALVEELSEDALHTHARRRRAAATS